MSSSASKRTMVDSESDYSDSGSKPVARKPVTKRAKVQATPGSSSALTPIALAVFLACTNEDLSAMKHGALLSVCIELREATRELLEEKKARDAVKVASGLGGGEGAAPLDMTKAEVAAKVEIQRKLMNKGISAQMGWKPSCKTGAAKFSYTLLAPFPVFIALFNLPKTYKKKTSHRLTMDEFRAACGSYGLPDHSVRYATLQITGTGVGVRWNAEENTAVVSGTYGKEVY